MLPLVLLVLCFSTATIIRQAYVNKAVTSYSQTLDIVTPFLPMQEVAQIKASFAQITTKKDYVAVMERLYKVAQKHKLTVREFRAW